jgi:hypothetical protein
MDMMLTPERSGKLKIQRNARPVASGNTRHEEFGLFGGIEKIVPMFDFAA